MSTNDKAKAAIVLTLEIFAADARGNRKLVISGAPQGEMPELHAGLFANRHALLDEVWISLQKRKPQVVKVTTPKKKNARPGSTAGQRDESAAQVKDETEGDVGNVSDEIEPADGEDIADARAAGEIVDEQPATEQLPLITGDIAVEAGVENG